MEEKGLDKKEKTEQLDKLMEWVSFELEQGKVPQKSDVVKQARLEFGFEKLPVAAISARLKLHPNYHMSFPQQRARFRNQKHRMIVSGNLGSYHCDIGYYSLSRDYQTPKTY